MRLTERTRKLIIVHNGAHNSYDNLSSCPLSVLSCRQSSILRYCLLERLVRTDDDDDDDDDDDGFCH